MLELYSKPIKEQFTESELKEIREMEPKEKYKIRYAFYKPDSFKKLFIVFIIDSNCLAYRKSGVEVKWETICRREISELEYVEVLQNFGANNRRFQVWYYKDIEHLIEEDLKYGVTTPKEFVDACIKRGYTMNKK